MTSVDRDVAHLLSSPFSGGVAWLSVLCNTNWGYAVSGSLQGSFPYPLEDNSHENWDLMVVAHELGHNFGTPHTHDLGIDGCGFGDCTDAHLGTIMSYCHLCSGGLSNIRLGFHELCQNIMYDMFDSTSCDSAGDCVPCTGDIDGNGTIGVEDLLNIIAAWGSADADADLDEDGIVGVDDLLIVISDWGPCP